MSTTTGDMKKFKVTDKQGNVYSLDPVDAQARQEIDEAKNLQFDDNFFTATETSNEVSIGLNGVPLGVDETMHFVQDSSSGIVIGVNPEVIDGKVDKVTGKGLSTNDLIDPSADNSILSGSLDGSIAWQTLGKSYFGGTITDDNGNAVTDDNGDPLTDDNGTELFNSFNGIGFGAERARADAAGNEIETTYAKLSDIKPQLIDAGLLADTDDAVIDVPNNSRSFLITSKAAITFRVIVADGDVPNFAVEIQSTTQTGIRVKATIGQATSTLKYAEASGNTIDADKLYQLTCVGTCWTIAEFIRPEDSTYDFGGLSITFTNGVAAAAVDNDSEFIEVTEPILVDSFTSNREYPLNVRSTTIFPFRLDDASKLTSGQLFEMEDIIYDTERKVYHAVVSDTPVISIEPNHPYVYIANNSSLTFNLDTDEQLLLVPTHEVEIPWHTSSGDWIIHGTYKHLVTENLPHWDPNNPVYYGFVVYPDGELQPGDFAINAASAYTKPMRMYFERLSPIPED